MKFDGKTAIVTGGSRGIGKQVTSKLFKEGANVVIAATNSTVGENLVKELQKENPGNKNKVLFYTTDIAYEEKVKSLFKFVLDKFSKIDILVNCAAVGFFKSTIETTYSEWEKTLDVNLGGTFLCSKEAAKVMISQGYGHIINFGSDQSYYTFKTSPVYSPSKFAVRAFTDVLSRELTEKNIKVSLVMPGATDTSFAGKIEGSDKNKGQLTGEDLANAVIYILSQPDNVVIDQIMMYSLKFPYKV